MNEAVRGIGVAAEAADYEHGPATWTSSFAKIPI
jgi:hypothetical protein